MHVLQKHFSEHHVARGKTALLGHTVIYFTIFLDSLNDEAHSRQTPVHNRFVLNLPFIHYRPCQKTLAELKAEAVKAKSCCTGWCQRSSNRSRHGGCQISYCSTVCNGTKGKSGMRCKFNNVSRYCISSVICWPCFVEVLNKRKLHLGENKMTPFFTKTGRTRCRKG